MDQPDDSKILITNAHLFGRFQDWYPGWLLTNGNKIHLIGAGLPPNFSEFQISQQIDAQGHFLLPGFIDLHAHGALGQESMDAEPEGIQKMARFFAQHGVTSFLPTTWSGESAAIIHALEIIKSMVGPISGGASILGAHLEGPYLNPTRCGAQDIHWIRLAEQAEAVRFLDLGVIRLLDLAPEFPENEWLIQECVHRNVTVSVGHSAATYQQVKNAAALGVTHSTHTFNAMSGLGHREPGTVGAVMALPEIICELICDNTHVHPAVQKILIDVKTPAGVILVTDCIRPTGMPEGTYALDNRSILFKDETARLSDGTLAGSTLTMEHALKNAMAASRRGLSEIWPMTSLNAARNIGGSDQKGSLEVGKDADMVLLNSDLEVMMTLVEGKIVFHKQLLKPDRTEFFY